jgi:hypothetical protein
MPQLSAREEREGERRRETGGGRWLAFFLVLRPCRAAASLACARPLLARFFPSFSFAAWRAFLPSSMGARSCTPAEVVCVSASGFGLVFVFRLVPASGSGSVRRVAFMKPFALCVGLGYQSRPVRFLLASACFLRRVSLDVFGSSGLHRISPSSRYFEKIRCLLDRFFSSAHC